ncbi:hypothetical protein [Lewinella sp. W8]|uniref:hypothetical protein n=1 Tax=Lewinella sp. W8 TaxID=2528208 RepID=UPI0010672A32|nr:hypothetical protein [Lewinella sp. W8]MTB53009.1 hypothetical protein [Lewinella sp. W8]
MDFQVQSSAQEQAWAYLFDKTTRSIGFGGGGGGGKSFNGAAWVWMMCNRYPGVRYFFGRKELKRLKQSTLVSYYEFCDAYGVPEFQRGRFNENSSTIFFQNGSEIVLLDLKYKPSDPLGGSFGSLLFTGGFIDESYEIPYTYIEVLYSRIGRWKNEEYQITPKILEASNPDKGHFYKRFYVPFREGKETKDAKFVPALAIDRLKRPKYFRKFRKLHSSDINTGAGIYVENLLRLGKQMQERLLWGNFEYDDDPLALIEYDDIQSFFDSRHLVPAGQRYLTADVALRGSDLFVITVWEGSVVIHLEFMEKSGGREVLDKIKELQRRFKVKERNITYDSDGVGGFVGGKGGFLPHSRPFVNGGSPMKYKGQVENYQNLKTQCLYHFAQEVTDGTIGFAADISPGTRELIEEEMQQIKRLSLDEEGRLRLKRKDDIRRDIGRSPDFTDALAMRMVFKFIGRKKLEYA